MSPQREGTPSSEPDSGPPGPRTAEACSSLLPRWEGGLRQDKTRVSAGRVCWRTGGGNRTPSLLELEEERGPGETQGWWQTLTVGGDGGEGRVVSGQRGGVGVLCAGQRVVVTREGGGRAQHPVGQVWAQVGAVGSVGHSHPVQGVGTAREGEVHPPVHQVLCRRRVGSRGQTCTGPRAPWGRLPSEFLGLPMGGGWWWHKETQPSLATRDRRSVFLVGSQGAT